MWEEERSETAGKGLWKAAEDDYASSLSLALNIGKPKEEFQAYFPFFYSKKQ